VKNLKEYCRPTSVEEAVRLKRELGERAVYLAGGTDLLVHRPPRAERAIDIRHAGLEFAGRSDDGYMIGGGALLRDAEEALKGVCGGMLRGALRDTAPWLIRNAATVAGNIANASPAADSIPALLVLDAQLRLVANESETVPLESIFVGPHCTTLGDRLIYEIRIPGSAAERQAVFIKLARSKSDIALVNVAVAFRRDGDRLRDVRIALGAVAPTPMRARSAEAALEGEVVSPPMLAEMERQVRADIRPISDWRASAEYRTRMSGVLARRAVQQALAQNERGSN
jgi:CO/xanthine dehydrogenase FAD-binding subunit